MTQLDELSTTNLLLEWFDISICTYGAISLTETRYLLREKD